MERCKRDGYEIVYISLYGSQNYGLDLYTDEYKSDFDFKAVVIPSLDTLISGHQPISTTISLSNGVCDIKDIRKYVSIITKGSIGYIETLYSKINYINPLYKDEFSKILLIKDDIVSHSKDQILKCCKSESYTRLENITEIHPHSEYLIKKYGYDGKNLCHFIRLAVFMYKFGILNKCLQECFDSNFLDITGKNIKEYMINAKLNKIPKDQIECYIEYANLLIEKVANRTKDMHKTKDSASFLQEPKNICNQIVKNKIIKDISEGYYADQRIVY